MPVPEQPEAGEMALALLDSLSDPVYVLDRQWRIAMVNEAFARYMRAPKAMLIGSRLWDAIPAPKRDQLELMYRRALDSGEPQSAIQEAALHPGQIVDLRVFPAPPGVAVVLRDVTRRVMTERALATSEEHLRRALDGAQMGDWSWDARSDRMTFSEHALALYGLSHEAQGMSRSELRRSLLHPDDIELVSRAAEDALASQGQYDVEYRVRRDDGWRWMRVVGGPHLVDGRMVGAHGLVQDIHQRKLANQRLQQEIEERERSQQRQLLLIHELNHRVKNILAMVQAIAVQTLSSTDDPRTARNALEQRLVALARAHDVLTRESWDGAELSDVVAAALAAHEPEPGARFQVRGPRVRLEPKTAVSLTLALHELATNAVKYGALSVKAGWVAIDWSAKPVTGGIALRLNWTEHDGPPVQPPDRAGFGSRLITRSLAAEQGSANLTYAPEGVRCEILLNTPVLTGLEMRPA